MLRRVGSHYIKTGSYLVSRSLTATPNFHAKKEKESWNTEPEKDEMPKDEWKSFFHYFTPKRGITVDVVHHLQKGIDVRPKALQKWLRKTKLKRSEKDQRYRPDRVAALGFDLAAAHFIVHRGGKVRFAGHSDWTQQDEDEEYDLPRHYDKNYVIEAIDATGTDILYEGLECIGNLKKLTWLSVANCPNIDDWCIDRICGQYATSLKHLDISYCPKITHRGIAALVRLKELESLHMNGLNSIKDIKFLCLLIEDVLPEIKITGIDYMNTSFLENSDVKDQH